MKDISLRIVNSLFLCFMVRNLGPINQIGDILYVCVLEFNSVKQRHETEIGKTTVLNYMFTSVMSSLETEAPPCA